MDPITNANFFENTLQFAPKAKMHPLIPFRLARSSKTNGLGGGGFVDPCNEKLLIPDTCERLVIPK